MNLPNRLTLVRIIMIPVMVIIWYIQPLRDNILIPGFGGGDGVSWCMFVELILFIVASVTDFLDGYLARKNNQVTNFGKFADPLADKILVFTAMLFLVIDHGQGYVRSGLAEIGCAKWFCDAAEFSLNANVHAWVFVTMLVREFAVSGVRMVVAKEGEVIAAGKLGKWKTATTMVSIIFLFLYALNPFIAIIGRILMYVACVLTVVSGIEYLYKSKHILFKSM